MKHFLTSLNSQQNIFKSQNLRNESSVRTSNVVAEMFVKNNRPFTEIKLFEGISLSTRTCVRRNEELRNNIFSQLKDIII